MNKHDKPVVRIENWSVVGSIIYYGFRNLEPGARNGTIYTSAILTIDRLKGLVETHNSIYSLGDVSEDYARWLDAQEHARAA